MGYEMVVYTAMAVIVVAETVRQMVVVRANMRSVRSSQTNKLNNVDEITMTKNKEGVYVQQ